MQTVGPYRVILAVGISWGLLCGSLHAQSAVFIDFSDYFGTSDGQPIAFPPIAVSSDGSTVFGQWSTAEHFAFRWRPGELPETIFTPNDIPLGPGDGGYDTAGIIGVADDGSAYVSHWRSDLPNSVYEPFRWTESGGPEGLGSLSVGHFLTPWTLAYSLSGDGRTVIGTTNDPPGLSGPFEWTVNNGLQPRNDGRRSLNYDGSIAAGTSEGRAAVFSDDGVLLIGPPDSTGEQITSDGQHVLVKVRADFGSPSQQFIWSESEGLVEIPPAPGSLAFSVEDISDDGSTAVGSCSGGCIWRRGVGSMSLEDYFRDELGLAEMASKIDLDRAYSVSADGTVIAGVGRNVASGKQTSWVVILVPEPTSLAVAAMTLASLARNRRNKAR